MKILKKFFWMVCFLMSWGVERQAWGQNDYDFPQTYFQPIFDKTDFPRILKGYYQTNEEDIFRSLVSFQLFTVKVTNNVKRWAYQKNPEQSLAHAYLLKDVAVLAHKHYGGKKLQGGVLDGTTLALMTLGSAYVEVGTAIFRLGEAKEAIDTLKVAEHIFTELSKNLPDLNSTPPKVQQLDKQITIQPDSVIKLLQEIQKDSASMERLLELSQKLNQGLSDEDKANLQKHSQASVQKSAYNQAFIQIYSAMAVAYQTLGQYEEALRVIHLCFDLYEEMKGQLGMMQFMEGVAGQAFREQGIVHLVSTGSQIYYYRNDIQGVENFISTNIKRFRLSEESSTKLEGFIGQACLSNNDFEKAYPFFKAVEDRALRVNNKQDLMYAWIELSDFHFKKQDYDSMLFFYEKAKNISYEFKFPIGVEGLYAKAGYSYHKIGKPLMAEQYFNLSKKVANRPSYHHFLINTYFYQGLVYQESQNYSEATQSYQTGIQLLEDRLNKVSGKYARQINMQNAYDMYQNMVFCKYQLTQYDSAFHYAEKSKSRTFRELMLERHIQSNVSQELRTKQLQLEKNVSQTEDDTKRRALLDQYQILLTNIREADPKYANLVRPKIFSQKQIQQNLTSEEVVVQYAWGENLFAFCVTKTDFQVFNLGKTKEITSKLKQFRQLFQKQPSKRDKDSDRKAHFEKSYPVYEALLKPILEKKFLKDKNRLIIIPDDELFYVPFVALFSNSNKQEKYANYDFLIKKYEISRHFSSSTFIAQKQEKYTAKAVQKAKIVVFANPIFKETEAHPLDEYGFYRSGNLRPLPNTKLEAESIRKTFGKRATIYTQVQAIEENFKGLNFEKYQILHLATHGKVNEQFPLLSAVYLNQDQNATEDGAIRVMEWANLEVKNGLDLIVLSACQTGTGRVVAGEGMIGFGRVLLTKSQGVILSLWNVNDASTAKFFGMYYNKLTKSKQTKTQALQQTCKQFISQAEYNLYAHPYFWGAFSFMGNN